MKKMSDSEKKEAVTAAKQQIAIDSESAKAIDEIKVESKASGDLVEAAMSGIIDDMDVPENRQGYVISVNSKAGFGAIIAYWVAKFLSDSDLEKLPKKTIQQMISDLEKDAHKNGVKLEQKDVVYEVQYKAINRK